MSGQRPAPTIGVTVSARAVGPQATGRAARSAAELCSALHRQHAEVLLLPPGADCSVSDLGGLVLGGGGDFDLALGLYTAPCSPNVLGDVDRARDDFELDLCRAAAATGLPVLGLCRGAQVMAAARGCSLFADIESECSPSLAHRCAGADAWHTVELDPASRLCRIVGDTHLQVNSSHHQAVDSLDEGVRRVAWSEDGITEAIEWGEGFFLGVQWHPERMENSPSSERLFRAFVEAAASYQRQRGDDQ